MDNDEKSYSPHIVVAPWTDQQVEQLNHRQTLKHLHQYTCGDCGQTLLATNNGWTCHHCRYAQQWCFAYDLDPHFCRF